MCRGRAAAAWLPWLQTNTVALWHLQVHANPLPLSGSIDADDWLAELAATPLTSVADPRRSSIPSAAAAAAVTDGVREVSPRDVAERIIALRSHVALEVQEDLELLPRDNDAVRRRCVDLCNPKC